MTISNDVKFLRKQAKENMKIHLEERLPFEFESCMKGMNNVLKMAGALNYSKAESQYSTTTNEIRPHIGPKTQTLKVLRLTIQIII